MKETGVQAGRFHPATAIYAVPRSFSRPILARTYSVEVTSFLSNLPHHRSCPLNRDSSMIHQHPRVCQGVFSKNFARFHGVSCGCFGNVDRGNLVPFCLPKKEPKMHQGASFNEHLACAGVHRRRPLDPRLRGTPSCFLGNFIRRTKLGQADSSCLGPQGPSSSQSPLYSGRPSVGIRHAAPLLLLSSPNPLRWALAGTPIKCLRCTSTAYSGITVAAWQLRMQDRT